MGDFNWQPFLASLLTSVIIGFSGCYMLCMYTKRPRKTHMMNVFNQQFFALMFMGFVVRSFLWVVWVDPGKILQDTKESEKLAVPIGVRAFLITYPTLNQMICSFLIQYPWLYDHIVLLPGNGRRINLVLR